MRIKVGGRQAIPLVVLFVISLSMILPSVAFGSTGNITKSAQQQKPAAQIQDLSGTHLGSTSGVPNSPSSTLLSSTWTPLATQGITSNSSFVWGAAPFSGRVTAIAINSSNTNEIFVGAAQGGLWRTTDGGSTWTPLLDRQASLAVGAVTLSPNGKVIYVGTGEGNNCGDCAYGVGVLKSIDGGSTWTQLGTNDFNGLAITSILVNPVNANELLVSTSYATCCGNQQSATPATYTGIWISTNAGSTWTEAAYGVGGVAQLALVQNSTTNYPIASDTAGNAYVYTNAANQSDWSINGLWSVFFNETSSGLDPSCTISTSTYCRIALATTASNPGSAYLAITNSSNSLVEMGYCDVTATTCTLTNINMPAGSTDQTGTFQPPCGSPGQGDYDLFFAVNPSNQQNMYFGCTTAFVTTDGGSTWSAIGGYSAGVLHPDMHVLAFMPGASGTVFIGNDGGIWKSTNDGSSWANLNAGLNALQFYHVAVSSSGKVLAGAQDNGCNLLSGNAWVQDESGDGGWVGFDPTNSNIMYCIADGQPTVSTDAGISFQNSYSGINGSGTIGTAPVGADPNNPNVFYFGVKTAIYKTVNDMQNWTLVYNDASANVISLSVSSNNSNTVYAGLDNGTVLDSVDAGATWNILGNLPNSDIASSIVVNATNSNDIYVAGASFESPVIVEFMNGIQKTIASSGLPNLSVNVLKIYQGDLYAGLDAGVYAIPISGSSWSLVASGLPNSAVVDLAMSSNGTLYAATHGRGVWAVSNSSVTTTSTVTSTTTTTSTSKSTTSQTTTSSTTTSTSSTITSTTLTTSTSTSTSTSSSSSTTSQTTSQTTSTTPSSTSTTSSSATSSTITTTSSLPPTTSSTTTQTTSLGSSSSSGGGVPEFSFQPLVVAISVALIIGSYLALRRRGPKTQ